MSQASFKKRLKALMNKPENQVCSDCPERQPRWASLIVPPPGSPPGSLSIGAFCCLECSGSHRRLGVHISFVRSITLDSWKEKEVLAMENGGNQKVNAIFEARLNISKPTTSATGHERERFIRDKYERRKYFDSAALRPYQDSGDSSSDDDSEEEQGKRNTVRAPSDAARKRAEARKNRTLAAPPKVKAPSSSSPSKKSRAVKKRLGVTSVPAPTPASPEVDLLDFGFTTNAADSGPPPNPPSASPSPTLDMFKDMDLNNGNADATTNQTQNGITNNNNGSSNNDNAQTKAKMNTDDILNLFNAPMNNNMGYNNPAMLNNNMNNGMMMKNNQINAVNTNASMMNNNMNTVMMVNNNQMNNMNTTNNNQMNNMNTTINNTSMFMNGSNNGMNTMMNSNNNAMPAQQMPQNNLNFFNGAQNMNGNMSSGMQAQTQQSNNMGMPMQQTQQQDYGIAPMGGTPSNLTVMGGEGMGQPTSVYGKKEEHQTSFDFMGGSTSSISNNGSGNPQINQFASFGSFR